MSFRTWTAALREIRGNQPLWPSLLGAALDEEFQRQRQIDACYKGDVFKDRDDHRFEAGPTERRAIAGLYHLCREQADGCLDIDGERFWLLGYEWPNQGGDEEKGRRADLVALTITGGLVVFECKRGDNADPPLTATARLK